MSIRIDKWLWSTRFFKTRSLATDACRRNLVKIDDSIVKPSKEVRIGDLVKLKKGPLNQTVRITALVEKRVAAPVANQCYEDLTPQTEYEKANDKRFILQNNALRTKGRPSKKDRRDLEDFFLNDQIP